MAKIPDGILGSFIGKAGPVTGYIRNGQNIIRTSSRRKDNKVTPKRTAQQEKLKLCNNFVKPFSGTGFFNKSFPAYGDTGTGYSRAMSALMNLAITGTYPGIKLSYPHVLISKGQLPPPENATASVNGNGDILFGWTDNSGRGTAKGNDKTVLVAYFAERGEVIYSADAGLRADCQAILKTGLMQGLSAETWIGFINATENDAANSVYTGQLPL